MQPTVLIVEDADTCAATLEIVFSALEVGVVVANSADQAWRMIEGGADHLAAIVTDLEMRGMDGYQLIERVRSHSSYRDLPIMVITGTSDPEAQQRVRSLGANAFFSKPYSPALVRDKMEQWLKHAKT